MSVVLASCRRIVGYVGWSRKRFRMRGSAEAIPGAAWGRETLLHHTLPNTTTLFK